MPILKKESKLFITLTSAQNISFIHLKEQCEQINIELMGYIDDYKKARRVSIQEEKRVLYSLVLFINQKSKLFDELEQQKNDAHFPKKISSFLDTWYFNPLYSRMKIFTNFLHTEYFAIESDFNAMPIHLSELIGSYQDDLRHLESFPLEQLDTCISKCKKDLLYLYLFLTHSNLIDRLNTDQLQLIALAHNYSFVNLLIGRKVLEKAKKDFSYFVLATTLQAENQLLLLTDISDPYEQRVDIESQSDKLNNNKLLVDEIQSFITQETESVVKCKLIKTEIECMLKDSATLTPWRLGWAGSSYSIEYQGKTYSVPHGIYELYILANNSNQDFQNIRSLVAEKAVAISPIYSFFSSIVGNARSEQTQETYKVLNEIVTCTVESLNDPVMLPFYY